MNVLALPMLLRAFLLWGVLICAIACAKTEEIKKKSESIEKPASLDQSAIAVHQKMLEAMGTFFTFTIATPLSDALVEAAVDAAFNEIHRIEQMMSTHIATSPISKVNQAAGTSPVRVPKELLEMVKRSKAISDRTEGKFDITFGAVGKLWHFRSLEPKVPDPSAIASNLPLLDYRAVRVDEKAQTLMLEKKGMSIGLGAIAKGYAVDQAAAILRTKGLNDFIVYGGGDIYLSGKKGDKPWRVGIQDPRDRSRYFADFTFDKGGAVVTSGDYEKYFIVNGRRYHHILDPSTGFPAEGTVSVTVITDHSADADALATGIFVLGPDKGMALIESDPKIEGVIVDSTFTPRVSSGLKDRITLRPITRSESEAAK
jgi:FAD:protein FMN transferase